MVLVRYSEVVDALSRVLRIAVPSLYSYQVLEDNLFELLKKPDNLS